MVIIKYTPNKDFVFFYFKIRYGYNKRKNLSANF